MMRPPLSTRNIDRSIQDYRYQFQTISTTGTNGKSSTTSMLSSIVRAAGEPSAEMTTLGTVVAGQNLDQEKTELRFLRMLEIAAKKEVRTLCLEVTSQALLQGFAKRWTSQVAIFTNLSQDHLDIHSSPEHYLAAKSQLFSHLPPTGTAILNWDDPASHILTEVIPPYCTLYWFSLHSPEAHLTADVVQVSRNGTTMKLKPSPLANALGGEIKIRAIGDVFAHNALGAALGSYALGYPPYAIKYGLENWIPITGRFEIVHHEPLVIIDYAHTPDGLQRTLETAQTVLVKKGKIYCVFGCGGNREKGKRPLMGQIANRLADRIIVTADNPRQESNQNIVQDIMVNISNVSKWTIEHNRKKAIELALNHANIDDVIIIAGKGHERTQCILDVEHPFSDQLIVQSFYTE